MKILISLLTSFCCLTGFSQGFQLTDISAMGASVRVITAGGADITTDMWMDFESNSDCTASQLDTSDHVSGANWDTTEDSLSKLTCNSTDADRLMTSTVNGTTDSGTKGLKVVLDGASAARMTFNSPTSHDNASVGFWYYTPSFGNFDYVNFFKFSDTGLNWNSGVGFGNGAGTANRYIDWLSGGSVAIQVSASTWYWIALQYNRNATCNLRVYDTSGSQVGSTSTHSSFGNFSVQRYQFGAVIAAGAAANSYEYIDNIVIDWTDATYPLGP